MASLVITTRQTKSGPRCAVRYRLGGRAYPIVHGGSFTTLREAKVRRDFIAGEIAANRNPADALRTVQPQPKKTMAMYFEAWKASRLDLDERTITNHDIHWKRLESAFGTLAPEEIDHLLVQEWITDNAQGEYALSARGLRNYMGTLKQVLDYTGIESNSARDRRIRYPMAEQEIVVPPSDKHVLAMLDKMPQERRLFFAFLEQDGGRLGEHIAFTWGDVDIEGSRILARPEAVKGRRGRRRPRWIQIPEWLMDFLLETCPPEDRLGDRPLFPWLHAVDHPRQAANKTMSNACKAAGIPHFHPHDLRHRRVSLWHGQGIPAREIGDRVGQRQIATTLNVYTHTMPLGEVPAERFLSLLTDEGK